MFKVPVEMPNKPFIAEHTNILAETSEKPIPPFGLRYAPAMQVQKRNLVETIHTSITSNPLSIPLTPTNYNLSGSQVVHAHREVIPGGVCFTFPTNRTWPSNSFAPEPPQRPFSLAQTYALDQLHKQGLEAMLLQEHLNKYQLKFHQNGQTSTADLLSSSASRGPQNVDNLLAIITSLRREIEDIKGDSSAGFAHLSRDAPPERLHPDGSKAKRLMLTKSPDLQKPTAEKCFYVEPLKCVNCKECQTTQTTEEQSQSDENDTNKDVKSSKKVTFDDASSQSEPESAKKEPEKSTNDYSSTAESDMEDEKRDASE